MQNAIIIYRLILFWGFSDALSVWGAAKHGAVTLQKVSMIQKLLVTRNKK